ncbi:MAG: AAA family ATPase [Acidimicrobiia bacterium]|nr:AAA family ATPase [Acidimicrobiia bacterium]
MKPLEGGIVGRDVELGALDAFLGDMGDAVDVAVLAGEAGAGKTALLDTVAARAAADGHIVLACSPGESERTLSYVALADLMGDVYDERGHLLPPPRRHALEAALGLSLDEEGGPSAQHVCLAVHALLRSLTAEQPVLVVVDDAQWLDASTARVLTFGIRRLRHAPAGMVAALRTANPLSDAPAISPLTALMHLAGPLEELLSDSTTWLEVGPLTLEDLGTVLRGRLGADFTGALLADIHSLTRGNPFLALEIAASLSPHELRTASRGEPIALPGRLRLLAVHRLADLDAAARRLVSAAALSEQLTPDRLETLCRHIGIEPGDGKAAFSTGVLERAGDRVRFCHPLLRAAAAGLLSPEERRDLHRWFAEESENPEVRASHLALASEGPDPAVALAAETAAATAALRAAPDAAGAHLEVACHFTPDSDRMALRSRHLRAGTWFRVAGDQRRSRPLLERAVELSTPGRERAEALLALVTGVGMGTYSEYFAVLDEILVEAREDPELQARVLRQQIPDRVAAGDIATAAERADELVAVAACLGEPDRRIARLLAGIVAFVRGDGFGEKELESLRNLAVSDGFDNEADLNILSEALKAKGDFQGARVHLGRSLEAAQARGDENVLPNTQALLSLLECQAGNLDYAARLADAAVDLADEMGQERRLAWLLGVRALVAACRGHEQDARRDAAAGRDESARTGGTLGLVFAHMALGELAIAAGEHTEARNVLEPLDTLADAVGIREPCLQRWVPNLVEALICMGESLRATAVLDPFEARSRALGRPWGTAVATRCRGLLAAAAGDKTAAVELLAQAVAMTEELAEKGERGRALLAYGSLLRRQRRRRAAADVLTEGRDVFDAVGAGMWLARVEAELGTSRPQSTCDGELTPAERRVADAVARGLSNRSVAEALFLSPKTVEGHLARIYRKLGIHSRTALANVIRDTDNAADALLFDSDAVRVAPSASPVSSGPRRRPPGRG